MNAATSCVVTHAANPSNDNLSSNFQTLLPILKQAGQNIVQKYQVVGRVIVDKPRPTGITPG